MPLLLRTSLLPIPLLTSSNPHPLKPLYLSFHSKTFQNFPCFSTGKPKKNSRFNSNDADLASDFSAEVEKLNTQMKEKAKALKKSKQLLFSDFCTFLDLNPDEFKVSWRNMNPDDQLVLVKGFVAGWGSNFHPLSSKSVRDLVDEFVLEDSVDKSEGHNDDSVVNLPGLKKLFMGLSPNN